jgi:copper oxidase (laccase) domain-containing protein
VGEEVAMRFSEPAVVVRKDGWPKPHLDLEAANRAQLVRAGIPPAQIDTCSLCTKCRGDLFHSFRRDGKAMGHMLSVIGLMP